MTVPVPDQLEYISDGDGTTTDFPYPKRFLQPDEIVVLLRDADGVDTQQYLNQHYSIAGIAWPNGGAISFYIAPASGVKVVRYRMTQAKQTVDLENRQRNDAKAVELQLDRTIMAIQDQGTRIESVNTGMQATLGDGKAAQAAAEAARDIAAGYASDAVSQGNIPIYGTRSGLRSLAVPDAINTIRLNGADNVHDGQGGQFYGPLPAPITNDAVESSDGWWERSLPTRSSTPDYGIELWGRQTDTGENVRIDVATLLRKNVELRNVFSSSSIGKIVVVNPDDDDAFYLNDSTGLITFDVSLCTQGRRYTFVNGGGNTRTHLDPGARALFNGVTELGYCLEFGAREAITIVRLNASSFRVLGGREIPTSGVDLGVFYKEMPGGTYEVRGRKSLAASSTTLIQLPSIFGGQASMDNVSCVHSLTKSGTTGVTPNSPSRVRGSDAAGTVGVSGPQIGIYNPNSTTYEIEFIISNLVRTS